MKTKLIKILLITFTLLGLIIPSVPLSQPRNQVLAIETETTQESTSQESIIPEAFLFPGRIEGTGTYFEIKDSEYLNITLKSTEEIKLTMESIPGIITTMIEKPSSTLAAQTQITIANFNPSTTYYKFQDDYHNKTQFTTNKDGTYSYIQDISQPHLIFIQPIESTIFIKDDSQGGDCYLIGNWNNITKTCALKQNVNETIEIDSSNIILDGNGHVLAGNNSAIGVYMREAGTIRNINITNFSYASYIYFYASGNASIYDSVLSDNFVGLGGYTGRDMRVERVVFQNNTYGVTNADKKIYNSTFKNNKYGLAYTERISVYNSEFTGNEIALYGGRGEVKNNIISNNDIGVMAFFEGFTLLNNTITNNDTGIILGQYDTYTPPIEYNNIYNNAIFNIKNTGASNKSAKNNWWGTTNPCDIEAKIYDAYDDTSLGIIEYSPVLTGSWEISPQTISLNRCITSAPGGIFKDTIWTLASSPYIITENTTLFPGHTLTIEPGVEVKFSPNTQLRIRGTLIAEGTALNRIEFTSDSTTRGGWQGIYLATNLGGNASIKFADFSYAQTAIYTECCWGGGPANIYDSSFKTNTIALGGYSGWDMIIERTLFEDNTYAITNADKKIYNSTFKNNKYGLAYTERISVYNSEFTGNEIALYGGRGEIKECNISNNSTGVQGFFEGFTLSKNVIVNNEIGVILTQYDTFTPPVEYNNIYSNTLFNLKNNTPRDKEAKHNWWGTTNRAEIDAKIYDGLDDPSLGIVYYEPILIAPVEIPPENQPPVCSIKLQQNGSAIDKINIGEFFDIYAGDSTDDTGIKEVRFSSDDIQDGNPTGEWTAWYEWSVSSGDWFSESKIKKWSFATPGQKEVWIQIKDTGDVTSSCAAHIEAIEKRDYAMVVLDGACMHDSDINGNPNPVDTAKLKCLPSGWILKNVLENNDFVKNGEYRKVIDTTDNISGWMKETDLNNDTSKQEEWKQKTEKLDPSKNPVLDDDDDGLFDEDPIDGIDNDGDGKIDEDPRGTVPVILEAVNKYYNSTDTVPSLYSSDDNSNNLSLFKNAGFPIELILSIIATESYTTKFNNENVTFDYGHGVSQATFKPEKHDIKRLQIVLNSDSNTQVAITGPGSPGQESDTFGNLTETAVKKFQEKYNILSGWGVAEKQGIVYSATRNKLNEILGSNRTGFETLDIPRNFNFEDRLKKGNYDFVYKPGYSVLDNRGIGSGIKVPPCEEIKIKDEPSSNHYKNCYRYKYTPNYLEYKEYEPHQGYSSQTFKYYSNTSQSVYSNIKDGLKVLKQSYVARCYYDTTQCKNVPAGETRIVTIDADTSYTVTCGSYTSPGGTTYNSKVDKINGIYTDPITKEREPIEISCSDFKIIDTAWRYNGRVTDDPHYLLNLSGRFTSLNGDNYFGPNYKNYINPVLPEDQLKIWKKDLAWADSKRSQIIAIHSPGDLRVYDSQGRSTGITNGEVVEDIPFSVYDEQNGFILLPFANGSYSYKVKGNEEGAYGLDIISIDNANDQIVEFNATDIPLGPNEVHQYAIDWQALQNDERGVTLEIDYEGDGVFDQAIKTGKELIGLPKIITPKIDAEYILNSQLQIQFSATDEVSGISTVTATLNGLPVNNNQLVILDKVGTNTFEVVATNNAGDIATSKQDFNVVYKFNGFLPPIKVDGSGIYKQGRTLPVKFQLTDVNNNFISTAIAYLLLAKDSDNTVGSEEIPLSTSNADTGNQFRYSQEDNQYIYNLSTNTMTPGSWQLKVTLDDGRDYKVLIPIKN